MRHGLVFFFMKLSTMLCSLIKYAFQLSIRAINNFVHHSKLSINQVSYVLILRKIAGPHVATHR